MKKRILAALLSLIVIMTLLPAAALADGTVNLSDGSFTGTGITFDFPNFIFENGTYSLTGRISAVTLYNASEQNKVKLVLDGANMVHNRNSISFTEDLSLEFKGLNVLMQDDRNVSNAYPIYCDGKLTITASSAEDMIALTGYNGALYAKDGVVLNLPSNLELIGSADYQANFSYCTTDVRFDKNKHTFVLSDGRVAKTLMIMSKTFSIATQPKDQRVGVGQTATFSIETDGSDGSKEYYQWLYNDGAGWKIISGANSKTLRVEDCQLSYNGYQFACVAQNTTGFGYIRPLSLSLEDNVGSPEDMLDEYFSVGYLLESGLMSEPATLYVSSEIPATGDNSQPMLYLALVMASALGIAVLQKKRNLAR